MRLGLLGPAEGDEDALREAVEFLLGDVGVDQVLYLGNDDTIRDVILAWAREIFGHEPSEDAFLERAVDLACDGSAKQIEALLAADVSVRRLSSIRRLPPPPARAVEMIADRIVLAVHDKAVLDEEDIANAHLIVYGRSEKAEFHRFGPRIFLTPGPLREGKVAVLEVEEDGGIGIALYDASGVPVWHETLGTRTMKVTVAG